MVQLPATPTTDPCPAPERLGVLRELLEADPARAGTLARAFLQSSDPREVAYATLLTGSAHYKQGQFSAATDAAEAALRHWRDLGEPAGELKALTLLGRIARDTGHLGAAAEHFGTALELARALRSTYYELDLLNLQAGVLSDQGDYSQALSVLGYVLELTRELGLSERQGTVLSNMGTLHTLLGNYPQALESLTEAYTLLQQIAPGSRGEATNLLSLGSLYQEMGSETEALGFFARAREGGRAAQDPLLEAAALNNMANSSLELGDLRAAADLFTEALALAREVGVRHYEIDNLDGLGQVQIALGDVAKAARIHQQALAIAREIGDPEGETDALLNLGRDYLQLKEPERALTPLQEGLMLAQHLGRQTAVFAAHERLAQAHEMLGDLRAALTHYRAFHEGEKRVFNQENDRRTRQLSVQFELERARHDAEEERLRSEVMKLARDEAEAEVRARTRELEEAQLEIVTRLAVAAEYRDDNTGEHTKRVGRNAAALAYALGWPEAEIELLFVAARLHDVGKIGVPDSILHKPGRLDSGEIALMQTHAEIGARILSAGNSRLLRLAEEVALAHHERWDGRGYPHGLAGEAIPKAARIVAVADVLDALTHARPYKTAWSVADALAELEQQSGSQFEPAVVAACLRVFGESGPLSPVQTPNGWASTLRDLQQVFPRTTRSEFNG